ncbi:serine-rich adhesin for platelets-like [Haliotis asinina]|uniref:serine-rich adhesin for platelets-like n=1 Tax=Haliotis asinina TaxID=109174 RepID=UPI003531A9CB
MTREEFTHSSSDTQANLELSEIAHLTENGFPGCGNTSTPAPPGPRHPSVPLPCSRYRYSLSTTETRTFRSRHSRCCVGTAAILLSLLTVGVFLGIMIHFTVVDILWTDDEGVSKQPVPRAETKLGNTVPDFLGSVKISNLEWDYTLSVSDSRPYRELAVAVEQELDRVFLLSPLKDIYNFSLVRTFRRGSIVAVFETVLTDHRRLTTDSLKEALLQGLETRNYIRGSGDVMEAKHGVDLDAESIQIVTISTTSLRDENTSHLLPILDENELTDDIVTSTTTVLQGKTEKSSPRQESTATTTTTTTTTATSPPSSTDDENNADTHIWIWRPPKTPKPTTKVSSSGFSTEPTSFSPPKLHSSTHVQSTDWHTAFWKDQFSNKQFPFSDFWYSSSTHIPKSRQTLPYAPKRLNPDESKDGQLSANPKIPFWTTGGSAVFGASARHPSDTTSFQDSMSTPITSKITSKNTELQHQMNSTRVTNDSGVVTDGPIKPSTNTSLAKPTTITPITVSSNSNSDDSFKPLGNENDNSIPKVLSELKKDDTDTNSSNINNVIENIPHDDLDHHHAAPLPVDESSQGVEKHVPIFNEDVLPVITPSHISVVSEIKTHANGHSSFDSESQETYTPVTKLENHWEEYPADLDHGDQDPEEGFGLQEHGVLPSPTHPSFEDYNLHETSMENYDYVPRYPDVNLIAQNDANDEGSFRMTSPSGAENSSHDDVVEDDGGNNEEFTQGRVSSPGEHAPIAVVSTGSALTVDPTNRDFQNRFSLTVTDSGTGSPDGSATVAIATQKISLKSSDLENARDENLNLENGSVSAGPVINNVTSVSGNGTLPHIHNNTHPINDPAVDEYKADVSGAVVPWGKSNTTKDNDLNISESLNGSSHRSTILENNSSLNLLLPSLSKDRGTVIASNMISSSDTTVHPSQTSSAKTPSEHHKDIVGVASSSEMNPVNTDFDDSMPVLQSITQNSAFDYEAFNAYATPEIEHTVTLHQGGASVSSFLSSSAAVYATDSMTHRNAEKVVITPTPMVSSETVNGIQILSSLLQPQISKQLRHEITTHSDMQALLQPKVTDNPASKLEESSVLLIGSSALFDADASGMSFGGSVQVTPMLMSNSDYIDGATTLKTHLTNRFHSVATPNIPTPTEPVGTTLRAPSVGHPGATDSYVPLSLETVDNPVAEPSEKRVNSPAAVSDKQSSSNSDTLPGANGIGQETYMNISSSETGLDPSDLMPMTRQVNLNVSDILHANSSVDSHDVSLTNMIPQRSFEGESDDANLTTKLSLTAEPDTLERKMHQLTMSSASPTVNNSSTGSTDALDSVLMTTSSKTPGIIQNTEQQSDSKNVSNSNPEAVAAVLQESSVVKDFMNSKSAHTELSSRSQHSVANPTFHSALNINLTMTNLTNLESDSNVDNVSAAITQPKDVMHMFTHSSTDVSNRWKGTTFHQEDVGTETARGWRTLSTTMKSVKDVDEETVDSNASSRWMAAGISSQDLDTMETSTQDTTGITISNIPISTTDLPSTEVDVSLNKEEELGNPYSTQSETGTGSPQTNACLDITVMTEFIPSCLDYFSEITHTHDQLEKCQHFLAGVICVTDEFYKYSGQQCTDTEISAFIKQHADLFKNALPNFDPLKCVV